MDARGVLRILVPRCSAQIHGEEIVSVEIPQKKGAPVVFDTDEPVREDTSLEALGKLKPAFKEGGTVTAGNAPGMNDGASALVVSSAERARALGVEPLARIVGQSTSGIEPKLVMMAPVEAIKKLLKQTGWTLSPDPFPKQAFSSGPQGILP